MPIFITQGRYSLDAIQGMTANPEDRAEAAGRLFEAAGGKILSYYVTLGEYDWLIVSEFPDHQAVSAAVLAAAGSGAVTDVRTTLAMNLVVGALGALLLATVFPPIAVRLFRLSSGDLPRVEFVLRDA